MKIYTPLCLIAALGLSATDAFTVGNVPNHYSKHSCISSRGDVGVASIGQTQLNMFSGGAGGDEEAMKQMEQQAKAMGISMEEVKLSMQGRDRLTKALVETRVKGGSPDLVEVERDGNNPSTHMEITITQKAKDAGKDALSKSLVSALKEAASASSAARQKEQRDMMMWVGEEMKRLGLGGPK